MGTADPVESLNAWFNFVIRCFICDQLAREWEWVGVPLCFCFTLDLKMYLNSHLLMLVSFSYFSYKTHFLLDNHYVPKHYDLFTSWISFTLYRFSHIHTVVYVYKLFVFLNAPLCSSSLVTDPWHILDNKKTSIFLRRVIIVHQRQERSNFKPSNEVHFRVKDPTNQSK